MKTRHYPFRPCKRTKRIFGHGSFLGNKYYIGDYSKEELISLAAGKKSVALLGCYSSTVNIPAARVVTLEGKVSLFDALNILITRFNWKGVCNYQPLKNFILFSDPIPSLDSGIDSNSGGANREADYIGNNLFTAGFYATTAFNEHTYFWNLESKLGAIMFASFLQMHPFHVVNIIGSGFITIHTTQEYFFGLIRRETETTEYHKLEYQLYSCYENGDLYLIGENFKLDNSIDDPNHTKLKLDTDNDNVTEAIDNNKQDANWLGVATVLVAIASFFAALGLGLFVAGYTFGGAASILVLGSIAFSAELLCVLGSVLMVMGIVFVAFAVVALVYYVFSSGG